MHIINKDFGSQLNIKLNGKKVTLHIFEMSKAQIKFGIDAANSIAINREEIHQKRQLRSEQDK